MKWWIGALLALMALPTRAEQTMSTGNGFLAFCQRPASDVQKVACVAYTRGIIDGLGVVNQIDCGPANATYQQRHDLLLKYIQDNPRDRHETTPWLYLLSQWAAYNCLGPLPQQR